MRNVEKREIKVVDASTTKKKSAIVYRISFGGIDDIKKDIDKYVVDLVFADPTKDLATAKYRMKRFIHNKSDNDKHGIIAEMLSHIIIREEMKMNHLSLLINLEDNSLKKGFDGVYQLNDDVWFGESKSTYLGDDKHKDNLNEALRCFREKVNGTAPNNPWSNAVNHFACLKNGTTVKDSIRKRIDALSSDFENGVFSSIEKYNVIPISTLFINDAQSFDEIAEDAKQILIRLSCNKMIFLCVDNDYFDLIINYLDG